MATFAADQVTRLETLLAVNVGVKTVQVNGHIIAYDDLLNQYNYWKAKLALENGMRVRASQINLSGF